jgi:hypothetical protein
LDLPKTQPQSHQSIQKTLILPIKHAIEITPPTMIQGVLRIDTPNQEAEGGYEIEKRAEEMEAGSAFEGVD